eukprot:GHRQ01022916.1.p2 GENE.GHRQ01022916.1~~GHRQ01022916.1.p2  ORF type:complete len:231 (+),score=100.12 GHRQ01022916.1:808-1500(+)
MAAAGVLVGPAAFFISAIAAAHPVWRTGTLSVCAGSNCNSTASAGMQEHLHLLPETHESAIVCLVAHDGIRVPLFFCPCLHGLVDVQASAARALQRLNDIPDLKEQLASSAARDIVTDSIGGSSLLNTSFGTANGAAALSSAAGAVCAPGGGGAGGAGMSNGVFPASCSGCAVVGAGAAGCVAGEVDDFKQLAEVLACSSNKWLREKAAAAVEQLAADDAQACRWAGHCN